MAYCTYDRMASCNGVQQTAASLTADDGEKERHLIWPGKILAFVTGEREQRRGGEKVIDRDAEGRGE